jgi:hypothetical protein
VKYLRRVEDENSDIMIGKEKYEDKE